jgi:hypothetical protein
MAAAREVSGVVSSIMARRNDTLVGIGPVQNDAGNASIRLEHNHPGYSTILSLLMGSYGSRKPIHIWLEEKVVNGENLMTLEWVRLDF